MQSHHTPPSSLPLPSSPLCSDRPRREEFRGDAVAGSPQRPDPGATAPACVLCSEEYIIPFICIYISSPCCSYCLPPRRSPSIYAFAKPNKWDKDREDGNVFCCVPSNVTLTIFNFSCISGNTFKTIKSKCLQA